MTIHNSEYFMEAVADWGPLEDCFPRNVTPSDVDGFVHLSANGPGTGKFLMLEAKTQRGRVSTAQKIAFRDMVAQGICWCIVVWCDDGDLHRTTHMRVFWPDDGHVGDTGKIEADLTRLRAACDKFGVWAEEDHSL